MNFMHTGGRTIAFNCNYCGRDISLQCRVQCAECVDVHLCSDCFASAVNFHPHQCNHDYRVVDCLDVPIFSKDWTTNEELLLLEGIDKFGAGNWKIISDYLGTGKTTKQTEDHYWELYMGIHGFCLPFQTFSGDIASDTETVMKTRQLQATTMTEELSQMFTLVTDGYTRGEEVLRDKNKDKTSGQKDSKVDFKDRNSLLPGGDLPGFMPLREDFDIEYENDAELILADMEFDDDDDHPSERELKLQVIRIYNTKLLERDARKRFVIDRGLVDFKKQQFLEKKMSKEERELVGRLKVFARFHSAEEHDSLVDSLLKARKLRNQIELYQHYRKMGIKTLEQAHQYEVDRKKKDAETKAKKHRESSSYLFENGRQSSSSSSSSALSSNPDATTSLSKRDVNGNKRGAQSGDDTAPTGASTEGDFPPLVDLSRAPCVNLLSQPELSLCQSLPMLPTHYLAAKDAIVREAFRNGTLREDGMRRILKLDESKTNKIFDFFVNKVRINDPDCREFLFLIPKAYQLHRQQTSKLLKANPSPGVADELGLVSSCGADVDEPKDSGSNVGSSSRGMVRGRGRGRGRGRLSNATIQAMQATQASDGTVTANL